MSWDAIGAIGEVLGAIAVFVTLAYIAVQVRSTNKLLLLQHREANRAAQFDVDHLEVQSADFAELIYRSEIDSNSLSEIEKRRVTKHLRNDLLHRHNMYLRGVMMDDHRVQRVGITAAAELHKTHSIAQDLLSRDGWDSQFLDLVMQEVVEESDDT